MTNFINIYSLLARKTVYEICKEAIKLNASIIVLYNFSSEERDIFRRYSYIMILFKKQYNNLDTVKNIYIMFSQNI